MLCTVEVIRENVDFLEMDGYQGRMQVCWSLTRFEHCCAIGDESNELTLVMCYHHDLAYLLPQIPALLEYQMLCTGEVIRGQKRVF